MVAQINVDFSKGKYTRTQFDGSLLKLTGPTVITSNPTNTTYWHQSGQSWELEGDKATIDSNAGSNYLSLTYNLRQEIATTYPILFRIKAKGDNIGGSGNYSDWGIQLRVTFTDAGLSGGYEEVHHAFPLGTWDEQQFSVLYTPTQSARYIYAYVYTRNYTGKITVWDLEVIELKAEKNVYGEWESEVIDLYKDLNAPVKTNTIRLIKIAFKYGDLFNVDDLYRLDHSFDRLSQFDMIICENPTKLDSQEQEVAIRLVSNGKTVYGYTYLGSTEDIPLLADADLKNHIDQCANLGFKGIFMDMAGYDYGVSRDRLNTYVNYAHLKGLAVMANAWTPSNLLSSDIATLNPAGTPTHLGVGDWILLESFFSRGDSTYANPTLITTKYIPSITLAHSLGVKVASLAYMFDGKTIAESLQDCNHSYLLSLILGVSGWSYGTTDFTVSEIPDISFGRNFVGYAEQVSADRWERETDQGIVWMEWSSSVRESGVYSTTDVLSFSQPTDLESKIEGTSKLTWFTSSDKENWVKWINDKPGQYVKLEVEIYS